MSLLQRAILGRRVGRLVLEQIDGLELVVLPDVFNPAVFRTSPLLAEAIAANVVSGLRVLDVGTGSGVAAIRAAACGAQVTAVDINPEAVRCARINALLNHVDDRIDVRHGDLFAPVGGERFDVVVCNPPFFRGRRQADVTRRGAARISSSDSATASSTCSLPTVTRWWCFRTTPTSVACSTGSPRHGRFDRTAREISAARSSRCIASRAGSGDGIAAARPVDQPAHVLAAAVRLPLSLLTLAAVLEGRYVPDPRRQRRDVLPTAGASRRARSGRGGDGHAGPQVAPAIEVSRAFASCGPRCRSSGAAISPRSTRTPRSTRRMSTPSCAVRARRRSSTCSPRRPDALPRSAALTWRRTAPPSTTPSRHCGHRTRSRRSLRRARGHRAVPAADVSGTPHRRAPGGDRLPLPLQVLRRRLDVQRTDASQRQERLAAALAHLRGPAAWTACSSTTTTSSIDWRRAWPCSRHWRACSSRGGATRARTRSRPSRRACGSWRGRAGCAWPISAPRPAATRRCGGCRKAAAWSRRSKSRRGCARTG